MSILGREWRLWRSARGRARHERRLRTTAIREGLSRPGGGRYGIEQIHGVAATAPPLLVGGAAPALRSAGDRLVRAASEVRAVEAQLALAEDELARRDGAAVAAGPVPPAPVEAGGTVEAGPEVESEPAPHPDEMTAADRSLARRLQARTVECVMILFDWFFYTQTYLQVSGENPGFADAEQAMTFLAAMLLGLVGPPIVLISARIIAQQLARWRDGLLGDREQEKAAWFMVTVAGAVTVVLTFVFYMVTRLRLQEAAGLGQDLPPNVWVLQLLVALLPVAVIMTDYWAATPRADSAASRVRLRTAAREARAAVPTPADLAEAARGRRDALVASGVAARTWHEEAWLQLYWRVTQVVGDAGYIVQLADNLVADLRSFVVTEQARTPAPSTPAGLSALPAAGPDLPDLAGDWTALDAAMVSLVEFGPERLRPFAVRLRARLRPDTGPDTDDPAGRRPRGGRDGSGTGSA